MSNPTSDEVAQNAAAGTADPSTPGLGLFGDAWAAYIDFVGNWGPNTALDIQAIGNAVATF